MAELPTPRLVEWCTLVDEWLQAWCSDARREVPAGLVEAVEWSLLSGGKRVRPLLVLAAADACGAAIEPLLPAAAALELVHTYSLVHDDLPAMDDDELRRGVATSHVRFDEGTAILVGDALQGEAFALLASVRQAAAESRIEAVAWLAKAAGWRGMVGGQYLDLRGLDAADEPALRTMHAMKTGALLQASVVVGALMAGAEQHTLSNFVAFGEPLGWLFQVVDDVLDVTGDPRATGKTPGSDDRHAKVTAIAVLGGVDAAGREADEQLARCLEAARRLPRDGGELPALARFLRERDR